MKNVGFPRLSFLGTPCTFCWIFSTDEYWNAFSPELSFARSTAAIGEYGRWEPCTVIPQSKVDRCLFCSVTDERRNEREKTDTGVFFTGTSSRALESAIAFDLLAGYESTIQRTCEGEGTLDVRRIRLYLANH